MFILVKLSVYKLHQSEPNFVVFFFLDVLEFFLVKENRMDAHNLAIVFSPNIVYTTPQTSRPEQILMEMEWNNLVVERLLKHANELFKE